jgi:hypothetical protein
VAVGFIERAAGLNEAAPIEAVCGPLGVPLPAGAEVAAATGRPEMFRPWGLHRLRGVREPRALLTLATSGA